MDIFSNFDGILDSEERKLIRYKLYSNNMKAVQASGAGIARIQKWVESGIPFMLCTAYRFLDEENLISKNKNQNLNARLAQDLKNNGYSFIQVEGSWVYWLNEGNFLFNKSDEFIDKNYGEVIYDEDDDDNKRGVRVVERSFFVLKRNLDEDLQIVMSDMIDFAKHICKEYEQESVLVAVGEKGKKQDMGRTTLAPIVVEITPDGIGKWEWPEYAKFGNNIVQEFWTRKRGRVFTFASVLFYEPTSQFDAMGIKAMGYLI